MASDMSASCDFGVSMDPAPDPSIRAARRRPTSKIELMDNTYWTQSTYLEDFCDIMFYIKKRNTTIRQECYCGLIQFLSCLYVLVVIPSQMADVKYDSAATALVCGIGCVAAGLFANTPFIIAPPTSISIFFSAYLRQSALTPQEGNLAVFISGFVMLLFGYKPLLTFITKFIPLPIQAGTTLGIGLITALSGTIDIGLIHAGEYTILEMGEITPKVVVTMLGVAIIAICIHYHIKGSFCISLLFCTIVWWFIKQSFPTAFTGYVNVDVDHIIHTPMKQDIGILTFELVFLYIVAMNGLAATLGDLSQLSRQDGTVSRLRWVYIVCGLSTILSGVFSGPPILLSAESAAGIRAGAKTGLSTLICGLLFLVATFFSPFLSSIPQAGTTSVLLVVAIILFQNIQKVDWSCTKDALPAFCVLFFIPCTYSILQGVTMGYILYVGIGLLTGDLYQNALLLYNTYFICHKREEQEYIPLTSNMREPDTLLPRPTSYEELEESYKFVSINDISFDASPIENNVQIL